MKKLLILLALGGAAAGGWWLYRNSERAKLIKEIILLTTSRAEYLGVRFEPAAADRLAGMLDTWETGNLRLMRQIIEAIIEKDDAAIKEMATDFQIGIVPIIRKDEDSWEPYAKLLFSGS